MTLTEKRESALEAIRRVKPYSVTDEDIKFAAKDIAEVTVFLDTVLPKFLLELKSVTEDI